MLKLLYIIRKVDDFIKKNLVPHIKAGLFLQFLCDVIDIYCTATLISVNFMICS